MASFVYTTGMKEIIDGTVDIDTDTLKVMLVTASYVPDKDDDVVDAGGANDAVDHEISVTGYTGGWGGAGRKTPTVAVVANKTDDRADIGVESDLVWTSLGAGATIAGAILIKEGGANDTTSRLLCYWDVTDTPTNGGNITLDFTVAASGGNIRVSV